MLKKIVTLGLMVSILSIASSVGVDAQSKMSDENQTISNTGGTQNEKLRDSFAKKENKPNFDQKETLADYRKQKSQGQKFSTGTKILIGVGITAAVLGIVIFAASRDKVEPFKNGVF
jgi:hypothetical protein